MPNYRTLIGINYAPGNKRAEAGSVVGDLTPGQVEAFAGAIVLTTDPVKLLEPDHPEVIAAEAAWRGMGIAPEPAAEPQQEPAPEPIAAPALVEPLIPGVDHPELPEPAVTPEAAPIELPAAAAPPPATPSTDPAPSAAEG